MQIYPSESISSPVKRRRALVATNPLRNSRPDSSEWSPQANSDHNGSNVVIRFPPDPTEPRLGKQFAVMPLSLFWGRRVLPQFNLLW